MLGFFFSLACAPSPAEAVTFVDQAQRLELIYAFLLDYRPGRAPAGADEQGLEVAAELIPVPSIDNRVGAKEEPIDPPPAIPRFRARRFFSSGLMAGGTYSPPLEVGGFTATWAGAELGFRFPLASLRAELRGFWIGAEVEGPITEPDSADLFELTNRGADLRIGIAFGAVRLYGGAGSGETDAAQTVVSDGARIETAGSYSYLVGGASLEGESFAFTLEQSRTEDFLDHLTIAISFRF